MLRFARLPNSVLDAATVRVDFPGRFDFVAIDLRAWGRPGTHAATFAGDFGSDLHRHLRFGASAGDLLNLLDMHLFSRGATDYIVTLG